MVSANKLYPLQEIVNEIQLPFTIRKPNYSSDFYCRVDRIENNTAFCTGFKNGKEYTARKYSYLLSEEVVFLNGTRKTVSSQPAQTRETEKTQQNKTEKNPPAISEKKQSEDKSVAENKPVVPTIKKPDPPILYAFFSNPAVMNEAYGAAVSRTDINTRWIQVLVVNYLALIKRKIRIIFENNDFDINEAEKFTEYFPAYQDCHFSEDDLSSISRFLADLFDYSLNVYVSAELSIKKEILTLIGIHKCEIRLSSIVYYPAVEKNGEITVFGVFALINTFLNSDERNSLAFDLLNEASNRSHYYWENLLMKSLPAKSFAKNKVQETEEKEKTILSLYVHRKLTVFLLSQSPASAHDLIKQYVEDALFIGDTPDYTIGQIADSIKKQYPSATVVKKLIDEIFAVAINRKYYNLIKWREMDNPSSFLKNAEKFCKKLLYISETLVTDLDEKVLSEMSDKRVLCAINREQEKEMKEKYGSTAISLGKIHVQLFHVSNDINDVLYDDKLLGSKYKWFFTFEQDEDSIIPEPKDGYDFVRWDPKVVGDSEIARITLLTDCCIDLSPKKEEPSNGQENGGDFEVLINEENEEFSEEGATSFFKALECSEKTPEPCRTVLYTHSFDKSLQGLEADVAEKVELIKKKFAYLPDNELKSYLNSQNSKHLQGRKTGEIPFYKFRISRSARLFFCYGSDLKIRDTKYPQGTIILSKVVTDHDKQDKAGGAVINQVFRFEEFSRKDTGIEVDKRTLVYEASTMMPVLSDEQEECSTVSLPCEIMGSAGSGKSSIAVEMYRRKVIENPNLRILYVANNPALVKHIRECLSQAGVINPECLTFGELSTKNYHLLELVQKDTFTGFRDSLYGTKFTAVEKDIFAMCFDSGIKGNACLAETSERMVPKKTFLRETAKKEGLSDELASTIYELAIKYDEYLRKNKIWDNNDLARSLIHKAKDRSFQKYDIILADEIQDMTGMQVQALIRCCKNYNICFLGDRNQVIVPSTFDFGELEKGLYGKLEGKTTVQRVLKKTYRCGEQLINYLNRLNLLRRDRIGAGSQEDDAFEESMRGDADSSMIAVLVTDPDTCHDFIEKAKETAQCSIIVDNQDTKDALAEGNDAPNIITVEDAKGLEYNIVVLYNFVRDNYNRFREIFDGTGTAKRSTLHRIVFNKYYVSCTRAIDRIVICENSEYADEFRTTLFDGLDEKNDIQELHSYLNPSTDSWLTEAIRLYGLGMYDHAADYLKKYISLNPQNVREDYVRYKDLCECQITLQRSKDQEDWRNCAETFELLGDYSSARYVYDSFLHDRYKVFIIDLKTGNPELYVNNPELTSRIMSEATISEEDARIIISSLFVEKQMNHMISRVDTALEAIRNGE